VEGLTTSPRPEDASPSSTRDSSKVTRLFSHLSWAVAARGIPAPRPRTILQDRDSLARERDIIRHAEDAYATTPYVPFDPKTFAQL